MNTRGKREMNPESTKTGKIVFVCVVREFPDDGYGEYINLGPVFSRRRDAVTWCRKFDRQEAHRGKDVYWDCSYSASYIAVPLDRWETELERVGGYSE